MGELIGAGIQWATGLLEGAGGFAGDAFAGAGDALAGAGTAAGSFGDLGPTAFGTAADFLKEGSFDALAGGSLAGTGADVASTAGSFLTAGTGVGAGFGTGADALLAGSASSGLASGTGSIPGATSPLDAFVSASPTAGFGTTAIGGNAPGAGGLSSNVANANASASVFDTGANPLAGFNNNPSAGVGATGVSAPSGVSPPTGVDPTAAATTAAAGGTPAASGSSSISDLLSKAGGGALKSVTDNPLGTGLGVAGLGYNILQGQKTSANQDALRATATNAAGSSQKLADQGAALQQYLTNGTLPPNYQSIVDNAIRDAKTNAISNAAAQGLPTDPTKNTALAATLAKIDASKAGMQTQVASQLFQSGSGLVSQGQTAAGLSGQLFQALVNNDTQQSKTMGQSIATLAAALNGNRGTKVPGTNLSISTG